MSELNLTRPLDPRASHSLRVHREAIRMIQAGELSLEAARLLLKTYKGSPSSGNEQVGADLLRQWERILDEGAWDETLNESPRGIRLRAASPLTALVPPNIRHALRRMPAS
jgi:hypothetical protein